MTSDTKCITCQEVEGPADENHRASTQKDKSCRFSIF